MESRDNSKGSSSSVSPRNLFNLPFPNQVLNKYLLAILAVAVAFGLRMAINAALPARQESAAPFLTFFGAVFVAGWFGGFGPGLFATILAAIVSNYFFILPKYSFGLDSPNDVLNLLVFTLEGALSAKLCDMLRRAEWNSRSQIIEREQVVSQLQEQRARFETTLASIGDAVIATDERGLVTFMNEVASNLTGWTEGEAIGQDLVTVFRIINEHSRRTVENPVEKVLREGRVVGLANHTILVAKDGRETPIDDSAAPIRFNPATGKIEGVVLVFRDVTERKLAEQKEHELSRQLTFLVDTGTILSSSLDYETTLQKLARLCLPQLADYCLIDVFDTETGLLRRAAMAHRNSQKEELMVGLEKVSEPDLEAKSGIGRVLRTGEREFVPQLTEAMIRAGARSEEHLNLLLELKPVSVVSVALKRQGRILGALSLFFTADSGRIYNEEGLAFIEELAERASLALDNARLYREEHFDRVRQDYLAEASNVLASSLDYDVTLKQVAKLAVPGLADWCSVHIVDPVEGRMKAPLRVALAHVDPAKIEWAEQFQKDAEKYFPYNPDAPTGLPHVLRTGETELYADIPDEMLVAVAPNEEMLRILRDIGYSSVMIVPMLANGVALGVIQFVSTNSKRHYNETDVNFAKELAYRAAMAVDNARLYREAQEAIAAQRELDQLKDRFLSIASHELRTPLTSIKGYAQLLQRNTASQPGNERSGRIFGNIVYQVNRMDKLISDMLDVSRIQSGQLDLNINPAADLVELVRRVVEQQQVAVPQRVIRLESAVTSLPGSFDEGRLEQVLNNLISNALKYSPEDKPVTVRLTRIRRGGAGAQAQIEVQDEGYGISEADQSHIFEKFYRVREGNRPQNIDGLGLGLYITYEIVSRHSGQIWLESQPGVGTTFYLALPLEVQPTPEPEISQKVGVSGAS